MKELSPEAVNDEKEDEMFLFRLISLSMTRELEL